MRAILAAAFFFLPPPMRAGAAEEAAGPAAVGAIVADFVSPGPRIGAAPELSRLLARLPGGSVPGSDLQDFPPEAVARIRSAAEAFAQARPQPRLTQAEIAAACEKISVLQALGSLVEPAQRQALAQSARAYRSKLSEGGRRKLEADMRRLRGLIPGLSWGDFRETLEEGWDGAVVRPALAQGGDAPRVAGDPHQRSLARPASIRIRTSLRNSIRAFRSRRRFLPENPGRSEFSAKRGAASPSQALKDIGVLLGTVAALAVLDIGVLEACLIPVANAYHIPWSAFETTLLGHAVLKWWLYFTPGGAALLAIVGWLRRRWRGVAAGLLPFLTGSEDLLYYLVRGLAPPKTLPWLDIQPLISWTRWVTGTPSVTRGGLILCAFCGLAAALAILMARRRSSR